MLSLSRGGELLGRILRRAAGARPDPSRWEVEDGPFFANHMCLVDFSQRDARMVLERAHLDDDRPALTVAAEARL